MMENTVKYPCRNCIYFKSCGDSQRTEPCNGRVTKAQKKQEKNGYKKN